MTSQPSSLDAPLVRTTLLHDSYRAVFRGIPHRDWGVSGTWHQIARPQKDSRRFWHPWRLQLAAAQRSIMFINNPFLGEDCRNSVSTFGGCLFINSYIRPPTGLACYREEDCLDLLMIKAGQEDALRSQCDIHIVYVPLHYFLLRPSVHKTNAILSQSLWRSTSVFPIP